MARAPESRRGLANQANAVIEGNVTSIHAGQQVAGLGDVNGDGYDDVAVAMPHLTNPEPHEGGIAILHGGPSGIEGNPVEALPDAADTRIEGNRAGSFLGDMAGGGDINGDGYDDLIIGNSLWGDSVTHNGEGVLVVYYGGAAGIESNSVATFVDAADTVVEGNPNPHRNFYFCADTPAVADLNGDGYADVAAGAPYFKNGEVDEGALLVFHGGAGGIPNSRILPVEEVADIVIEGNLVDLYLGFLPQAAGDVNGDGFADLVTPAPYYYSAVAGGGAVLIYHGGADTLADEPDGQHYGQIAGDWLGSSSASAGDVNGDGFSDLAVGVPDHDAGTSGEGRVHVFHGSSDPSLAAPHWTYDGQFLDGGTGGSVASAGDVNGDGYGDLVVGTAELDHPETDEGRVDVFHGSATGLSTGPDWFFESNLDDATLGWQVASAGDINGDGYGDLIVGAPGYSNGQASEGRAYVFYGSSEGLAANPGWTFESDLAQARFGDAVSSAGDVNGDGFADVIVGAPGFESGHTNEGAAFGFLGSIDGLPDVPNWIIETNRPNSGYGERLTALGDVNGDGYCDVAIGALQDDNPELREGRVYIYHGSPAGLSTSADRVLEEAAGGLFGAVLSGAGDVNGDGLADLIVGSPGFDCPALNCGRAYFFVGSASGIVSEPAWFVEGSAAGDAVGIGVAGIGDHNGDGFSDVIVGVPGSDAGAADGGSIELYLGNAGAGRPVLARQSRGGGDPTPVQPWGLTHSGDDFQVSMTATSPRGRELAKIHVEACPPGEVWGHPDCRHVVSASWTAIPLGEYGVVLTGDSVGAHRGCGLSLAGARAVPAVQRRPVGNHRATGASARTVADVVGPRSDGRCAGG